MGSCQKRTSQSSPSSCPTGSGPGRPGRSSARDVSLETQSINIHATFSQNIYMERRKGKKSKPYLMAIHPEMMEYVAGRSGGSHPEAFLFINPKTGTPIPKTRSEEYGGSQGRGQHHRPQAVRRFKALSCQPIGQQRREPFSGKQNPGSLFNQDDREILSCGP